MTAALIDGAFTLIGWSLSAGAWAVCLAAYPLFLAYAYLLRESWWAFEDSLIELRDAWVEREQAVAA